MSATRAAWREPMLWLALAIPAATVAGGIGTLRVARGGLDAAPESVRRTAQAQVADLAPDLQAATRGLAATMRIDDEGRIALALPADIADDRATLTLVHPTRADADLHWTRAAAGATWIGPRVSPQARGHWIIEAASRQWRLVGAQAPAARVVELRPAVQAP